MKPFVDLRHAIGSDVLKLGVYAAILVLAALLGYKASFLWLALPVMGVGAVLLIQYPHLGVLAMVPAALLVGLEFNTGTAVRVNPVTLLIPALLGLWLLDMMRRRKVRLVPSRTNKPLVFFLFSGLLSLLIGTAIWDPSVPRSRSLLIVQWAQWAIFFLSASAYWQMGNLIPDETWLRRLTFFYLAVAGSLAAMFVTPQLGPLLYYNVITDAVARAPFWMLLTSVALGQLLFNHRLTAGWRLYLLVALSAVLVFAFIRELKTASNWISVVAVSGVLFWLRFPRLRWPVVILLLALAVTGFLSTAVYEFAGGDEEWEASGGSRLALIGRVVEVTMHNPVTGLGPAAYRAYAQMKPLPYGRALWMEPRVSSHNNYVDLFSHVGLLGLGLFLWFVVEVTRLGLNLRTRFREGFAAGYVNAMLAVGAGSLLLMLFADWILPYVYNIGFPGFQASVLVWLFLGGLVSLDQIKDSE